MTNQELLQTIKIEAQESMDKRGMFNENPFDKPRKVTCDDVLMERIEKAKKRVEEDERLMFKISSDAHAREVVHHFSQALERMGIDIELVYTDDMPYLTTSTNGFGMSQMMDVYIKRISDQNLRRMLYIEDGHNKFTSELKEHGNNHEPMITLKEHKKLLDKLRNTLEAPKKNKKNKKKEKAGINKITSKDIPRDHKRRLIKKESGKLNWSDGKSFEEVRGEPKNTEYQEKIKWFCEKYGENYEIIYESFKDDDLDNLIWKGEKVEFPKK